MNNIMIHHYYKKLKEKKEQKIAIWPPIFSNNFRYSTAGEQVATY